LLFAAEKLEQLCACLTSIIYFLLDSEDLKPLVAKGEPIRRRQILCMEIRVMDACFYICETCIKALSVFPKQATLLNSAARFSYSVIQRCCQNFRDNEEYIAKNNWIQAILRHIGLEVGAEQTLTTLLSNNKKLLRDYVSNDLIKFVVTTLSQKGPKKAYLDFLVALCSCLGEANSANQEDILKELLLHKKHSKMLLRFEQTRERCTWNPSSVENQKNLENINCLGRNIIDEGLLVLNVRWESSVPGYNPKDLYTQAVLDRGAVPLQNFCDVAEDDTDNEVLDSADQRRKELYSYFVSQLKLFTELCFQRSYNCINVIRNDWVTYDVAVSVVNDNTLPYTLRTAMTDLLVTSFLDQQPNQILCVPRLCRDFQTVEVWLPSNDRDTEFLLLQDFSHGVLQDCQGSQCYEQQDRNTFLLSVLNLTLALIKFGFYGEMDEIYGLVTPLLSTLDGRQDTVEEGGAVPSRARPSHTVVQSVKKRGVSEDHAVPEIPVLCEYDQPETVSRENKCPRYAASPAGNIVMSCKMKMCEILLHLLTIISDVHAGRIIQKFKTYLSDMPLSINDIVEWGDLEIKALNDENFVFMVLDLIMYEMPQMQEAAIRLLFAHHKLLSSTVNNLKNTQLLVNEVQRDTFKICSSNVLELQNLLESHEVWGVSNEFSDFDDACYRRVVLLLENLCSLLLPANLYKGGMATARASKVLSNQMFFLRCGLLGVCVTGLKLAEDASTPEELAKDVADICTRIYKLFVLLCQKNKEVKKAMVLYLDLIASQVMLKTGASDAILAMLQGEDDLIAANLSDEVLLNVCRANQTAPNSALLHLLGGFTASFNQDTILRGLLDNADRDVLVLCQSGQSYADRIRWIATSKHNPEAREALQYHKNLLRLLILCTRGLNHFTELKCTQLYPLTHLLTAMLDEKVICDLELRSLLAEFLFHVYLEAEVRSVHLPKSPLIWKLWKQFADLLEHVDWFEEDKKNSDLAFQKAEFCMVFVMSTISTFLRTYWSGKESESHKRTATRLIKACQSTRVLEFLKVDSGERESISVKLADCERLIQGFVSNDELFSIGIPYDRTGPEPINISSPVEIEFAHQLENLLNSPDIQQIEIERCQKIHSIIRKVNGADHIPDAPFLRGTDIYQSIIQHALHSIARDEMGDTVVAILEMFVRSFQCYFDDDELAPSTKVHFEKEQTELLGLGIGELILRVVEASNPRKDLAMVKMALKLSELLFGHGDVATAQQSMMRYFKSHPGTTFFACVSTWLSVGKQKFHTNALDRERIEVARELHREAENTTEEKDLFDPEGPFGVVQSLLRLLQMMCENQNKTFQEFLAKQQGCLLSVDVTHEVANLLAEAQHSICDYSAPCILQILETTIEFLQGPCYTNQKALADSTLILVCNNLLNSHSEFDDLQQQYKSDLFQATLRVLSTLLERRPDKFIHMRMASTLSPQLLQGILDQAYETFQTGDPTEKREAKETMTEIFALQVALSSYSPNFSPGMSEAIAGTDQKEQLMEQVERVSTLTKQMGNIEIMWDGQLQKLVFPIPPMCSHLTEMLRQSVVWKVDRESAERKLSTFLVECDSIFRYLKHHDKIQRYGILKLLLKIRPQLRNFNLLVATVSNISLIAVMQFNWNSQGRKDFHYPGLGDFWGLRLTGWFMCGLAALISLLCYLTDGYLKAEHTFQENSSSSLKYVKTALVFLFHPLCLLYAAFATLAALFALGYDVCGPILLLDIITRSETLQDVIRAVVQPIWQLTLSLVLGAVVLLIFATFGLVNILKQGEAEFEKCKSLGQCFQLYIDYGFRSGGGIGDIMSEDWDSGGRAAFKLAFFMLINVILLNIIFGIIIDTFSALREEHNNKEHDMNNFCFICSISREELDRSESSFKKHIQHDHNMWSYLHYYVHLKTKKETDFTGADRYITEYLAKGSVEWFPIGKAFCLGMENNEVQEKAVEQSSEPAPSFNKTTVQDVPLLGEDSLSRLQAMIDSSVKRAVANATEELVTTVDSAIAQHLNANRSTQHVNLRMRQPTVAAIVNEQTQLVDLHTRQPNAVAIEQTSNLSVPVQPLQPQPVLSESPQQIPSLIPNSDDGIDTAKLQRRRERQKQRSERRKERIKSQLLSQPELPKEPPLPGTQDSS